MRSVLSRTFLLGLLIILITACASKSQDLKEKNAMLYFGAGTQALMTKDYTLALNHLLTANDLMPNSPDIINNLAMAYYFKGETDLAIKNIERVLELDPKNSDVKVNLAGIYYQKGDIQKAEALYKTVLKDLTYDKQARTYYNLGLLEYEKRKNEKAAEDYFNLAVKEDENYCPAHFHLGVMKFNRHQYKNALRSFKEATIGTCYEDPAGHFYQALTMMELKRYDDARLKLQEIDTRFGKTVYGVKARTKMVELSEIEKQQRTHELQASRKDPATDF